MDLDNPFLIFKMQPLDGWKQVLFTVWALFPSLSAVNVSILLLINNEGFEWHQGSVIATLPWRLLSYPPVSPSGLWKEGGDTCLYSH